MTDKLIAEADHPMYPRASPEEADGVAWVFYDPHTFGKYYYKLPEMGPTDVRIRTLYAGVCHSDIMNGRGKWGQQLSPLCPGHEVVGEVIAIGSDVTTVRPGDQVMFGPTRDSCGKCEMCHLGETTQCTVYDGTERYLYGLYFGGFASHQQHPESHCFMIPPGLAIQNAAPLMCAGVTVFAPMHRHLKKGMRMAVIGVGGLGHLAVQYGVKMGMKVDAFMSGVKKDKEDYVKSLGVIDIHHWKDPGVLKGLQFKYDAVINALPVAMTTEENDAVLATLKPYGKLIVVGIPDIADKFSVDFFSFVERNLSIIGSNVGGRKSTEAMLHFSAEHHVECLCEHFTWEQFPQAIERIEKGAPKFRCVVDMAGAANALPKKH